MSIIKISTASTTTYWKETVKGGISFMAIEYLGLSEINGPLVVLEGVKNASYEEIVEFHMEDGTQKIGRIVEIYEDKAVIQVFEGTDNMSLGNHTHTSYRTSYGDRAFPGDPGTYL